MTTNPLVARYLERLSAGLTGLAPAERQEVVNEITHHIEDATAAGKPLDAVLLALGDADALARAYKVELLLNPRQASASTQPSGVGRWRRLAALVIVGSLPTFIIVVVLGSVGASLTFAGTVVFGAGVLVAANVLPSTAIDVEPWFAMAVGPGIAVLGLVALIGLVAYIRAAAKMVRRVLPNRTHAT